MYWALGAPAWQLRQRWQQQTPGRRAASSGRAGCCCWAGSWAGVKRAEPWEPFGGCHGTNKLHVWEKLCFPVGPSPALSSPKPPETNTAVTSKVKHNKTFLFWLLLKDMGFVFVWFCVNTSQFCLCKTNNSILGLYFKYTMGNETVRLL